MLRPHRANPVFAALLVALAASSAGAATSALWSQRFGTAGASSRAYGLAVDPSGNVVMAGSYNGLVDFGGGGMLAQGTDVVLACYNNSGTHQWSRGFGGAAADQAYAVAFDPSGNIVLTGYFQQTAQFGGSVFSASGGSDIFVAKYDANGNHVWSRALGTPGSDVSYAIATDPSGNVAITGYFNDSDIVLARYSAAGTPTFIKLIGSPGYNEGLGVTMDSSGNVMATGSFSGTVDFGGGNLSTSSPDEWDVFVAKYTAAGAHLWSRRYGDVDLEEGTCIQADADDNVVVAGYFAGTVSFGGDALVSSSSDVDMFLAKYDSNGNHVWSRRLGGSSYEYPYAIAMDAQSNVCLTGYFAGTANFGAVNLVSAGNIDIFCAQYDPSGIPLGCDRYGGTSADAGQAVALGPSGNRYVAGYFNGSVDFGGQVMAASGIPDMFLVKYGQVASGVDDSPSARAIMLTAAPNPFNPSTMIRYKVPRAGHVVLSVHDVRGIAVATLVDGDESAGEHVVQWRGRDDRGNPAASGVYFARVAQAGRSSTCKLVLLK